jgi:hypothetical protein
MSAQLGRMRSSLFQNDPNQTRSFFMKESRSKFRTSAALPAALLTLTAALASHVQAQTYQQLNPLPGGMTGAPILVSNNPESVSRAGLLLGMEAMTSANSGMVTRRLTGVPTLDSGCPSGGMREFSFYMHHIFGDPTGTDPRVDRIFLVLEPVGASATFSAFGVAISQRDIIATAPGTTLDPGRSPSYSVSRVLLTGTMPTWVGTANGSKIINIPASNPTTINSPTEVFQLRANPTPSGASLDARISFRASSGCLRARLVAAPSTITTAIDANNLGKTQYAWGNVQSTYKADGTTNIAGGTPCTGRQSQIAGTSNFNWSGWGRPAGIYQFNKWNGTVPVTFTATGQVFGYRYMAAPANLLIAPSTSPVTMPSGVCDPSPGSASSPSGDAQRPVALRYYSSNTATYAPGRPADRDSDKFSTANYGAEYNVTYNVTNSSTSCMKAQLVFAGYPGTQSCPNYVGEAKTRHFDGDFKITTAGVAGSSIVRAYIKCNTSTTVTQGNDKSWGIPAGLVTEQVLAERVLGTTASNNSVTWSAQNFIPGLIAIPGGMLVRSVPAACP